MKIALFGKLRAGKSSCIETFREVLSEKGLTSEHIEFGDPVKEVVEALYPKLKGVKDRDTYIRIGQHLRKLDEDIWVNCIVEKVKSSKCDVVFVGGTRQMNEYKALKDLGFIFIEIVADEEIRIQRCIEAGDKFERSNLNNPLEAVMKEFKSDYIIENNGTEKELKKRVREIIRKIYNDDYSKFLKNNELLDMKRSHLNK